MSSHHLIRVWFSLMSTLKLYVYTWRYEFKTIFEPKYPVLKPLLCYLLKQYCFANIFNIKNQCKCICSSIKVSTILSIIAEWRHSMNAISTNCRNYRNFVNIDQLITLSGLNAVFPTCLFKEVIKIGWLFAHNLIQKN